MIKKILNTIKGWFTPGKAIKCGTHVRYKKSCSICREVAGEI
jgi:hypothetical protein